VGAKGFDGGNEAKAACRGPTNLAKPVETFNCRTCSSRCLRKASRLRGPLLRNLGGVDKQDSDPGRAPGQASENPLGGWRSGTLSLQAPGSEKNEGSKHVEAFR